MRHARFVVVVAFLTSSAAIAIEGCGSGTPTCPPGDVCTSGDNGGDGGKDIGNPSDGGGSGGDSGGTLPPGCTDGGQADDDPNCNACLYAHCCKQIDDCAADPNCVQLQKCLAACASTDEECLLTCEVSYDPTTLNSIAACDQAYCADAGGGCSASGGPGGGFDAF